VNQAEAAAQGLELVLHPIKARSPSGVKVHSPRMPSISRRSTPVKSVSS
jgi:hypothetical protein